MRRHEDERARRIHACDEMRCELGIAYLKCRIRRIGRAFDAIKVAHASATKRRVVERSRPSTGLIERDVVAPITDEGVVPERVLRVFPRDTETNLGGGVPRQRIEVWLEGRATRARARHGTSRAASSAARGARPSRAGIAAEAPDVGARRRRRATAPAVPAGNLTGVELVTASQGASSKNEQTQAGLETRHEGRSRSTSRWPQVRNASL